MILLDTHAWIWLTSDPDHLSDAARKAIRADRSKSIAAISLIVATALARGALLVTRDEKVRACGIVKTVW